MVVSDLLLRARKEKRVIPLLSTHMVLERVVMVLCILERGLLIAIMVAMVLLSSLGIAVREILPSYASMFAWTDEATRLLMVWLVFAGLGVVLGRKRHIAVTVFFERLSQRWSQIIRITIDIIGFLFCLYLSWLGIELTVFVWHTGQLSPTLNLPMYWIYIAPTLGFFLMALRYGMSMILLVRQ